MMTLGKQPVELRVDALKIGGVKLLAKRSLPVIPHGHRSVEAFGQVFPAQPGRCAVFQPDLRLIALPEDLVRGIRNQSVGLRADRDILLLASFRQVPRGEGAEERGAGTEDLKEMQALNVRRGGHPAAELRERGADQFFSAERLQAGKVAAPALAALAPLVDLQAADPAGFIQQHTDQDRHLAV